MSISPMANLSLTTSSLPSTKIELFLLKLCSLRVIFSSFTLTCDTLYEFRTPMAYMTRAETEMEVKPAPFVAAFSSRGPNTIEPAILKVSSLMFLVGIVLYTVITLFV